MKAGLDPNVERMRQWPHTTTHCSRSHGEPVGVTLFDAESYGRPMTAIYCRFEDGSLYPVRTVDRTIQPHHDDVIGLWSAKGVVVDCRLDKTE